ncbi:hypothetical protein J3459_015745 [Metarhizium acridum]|nr:hypothetical protein J3459_015745 [Metarhizium acridum]
MINTRYIAISGDNTCQLLRRFNTQAGTCSNKLSGTFSGGATYCGDLPNAIFLKGSNGNYDNMDIDCDGANNSAGGCANDPTGQGQTAFKDTVKTYGIPDLDANLHPYVVFGNEGASPSFNPQSKGMKPLSVMAVVCNNQVVRIIPVLVRRCIPVADNGNSFPVLWSLGRHQRIHFHRRGVAGPWQALLPQRGPFWRQWP